MSLTHQDLELLRKPFPANAHKFTQGTPYIHEIPVSERLDMVDPSWELHVVEIEHRENAGHGGKDIGTVYVHVSLIVKGVRRDGVGMAVIQQTNPIAETTWENGVKKNTGKFYSNEANSAEKAATTDALKRAFRLFGGGRYLLAIPKDAKGKLTVSNVGQLDAWLKATYGDIKDAPVYYDDDEPVVDETATPANVSPIPQVWNKDEQSAFWSLWCAEKKYAKDTIFKALGVKKGLGEYTGSAEQANAAMQEYIQKVS